MLIKIGNNLKQLLPGVENFEDSFLFNSLSFFISDTKLLPQNDRYKAT